MKHNPDYNKWVSLYDQLQYSSPEEVGTVWNNNLYDINYLRRNSRAYYEHLRVTKDIIKQQIQSSRPCCLVPLVIALVFHL